MKKRNKILIGVGIVVLLIISFFIFFPFYLVGPTTPLYTMDNQDTNSHEVVIEIFDSDNKSIFKETREIGPKEVVERPKPFLLKLPTSWPEGSHFFKVTLDDEITETLKITINPWVLVQIDMNSNPDSGELAIGMTVVVV